MTSASPDAAARRIPLEPLTQTGFAPYGGVVEVPVTGGQAANAGTALRFDDVVPLVLTAQGGRPQMSIMRVVPVALPVQCRLLERHPRSSQLFMPIGTRRFLLVVGLGADAPAPETLRAFVTTGAQGVNYAPGTWHHPALALDDVTDFLVIGHASTVGDCDIVDLAEPVWVG